MKQISVISLVGTTASGKTAASFALAQMISAKTGKKVVLVSADSRQVYKGIPILSGADVPEGLEQTRHSSLPFPFFTSASNQLEVHGIGILESHEEWSVAQFRAFALAVVKEASVSNSVVLVVGGTGLYHQQLTADDAHLAVPPNIQWRQEAKSMTVLELQTALAAIAPNKLESMNNSDKNNPRRLQRAIEVARGFTDTSELSHLDISKAIQQIVVGLQTNLEDLEQHIKQRVQARVVLGAIEEVATCLKKKHLSSNVTSSLGFSDIENYLAGTTNQKELVANWTLHEFQYAKRQITWWKSQKNVTWFDANTGVPSLVTFVLEKLSIEW